MYGNLQVVIITMVVITIQQCLLQNHQEEKSISSLGNFEQNIAVDCIVLIIVDRSHHWESFGNILLLIAPFADLHYCCQQDATSQHFLDLDPHKNLLEFSELLTMRRSYFGQCYDIGVLCMYS